MEKGDAAKYLVIVLVFAGLAAIVLVLRPSPTGYAILGDHVTEEDCVGAGGTWTDIINQTCTDIPDCEVGVTGCAETCEECIDEVVGQECSDLSYTAQLDCETAGGTWTDIINQTCTDIPDCEVGVTGCAETCEECIDEVVGQECVGNCGSEHLDWCEDAGSCETDGGGYWYDANEDGSSTCNVVAPCVQESVADFCSRLGDECGDLSAADNCGDSRTVDCGSCGSGYECSSGSCVEVEEEEEEEEESSSSSSSSETTREEGKNLELSGQDKVLVSAGSSEEAELHIVNVGKYQLNCDISNENWISSEEKIEQLDKTKEVDIKYKVSVPVGTDAGDYSKELIVKCTGAISESKIIDVTVVAGEGSITGEVIGGEESGAGITGGVIGAGSGRFIAYIVFLLVLVGAVVLVWKRHAQIKGLDDLLFRGKEWFNTKFHKGK